MKNIQGNQTTPKQIRSKNINQGTKTMEGIISFLILLAYLAVIIFGFKDWPD